MGVEIHSTPEAIKQLLTSLKSDVHFSKTFEGTAKNGKLSGSYSNMVSFNGLVIGYVKIIGTYDLKDGRIQIKAVPNMLFWLVIGFFLTAAILLSSKGFLYESSEFVVSLVLIFFVIILVVLFLIEKWIFYKEIYRVINN